MYDEQVARGPGVATDGGEVGIGQLLQRFGDIPGSPVFGVLARPGSTGELMTAVALAELRRRCGSSNVSPIAPATEAVDVNGEVALPRYSPAGELSPAARRLAALVVTLPDGPEPPPPPSPAATPGPPEYEIPRDDDSPSPLALAWRVGSKDLIDTRIDYLRVTDLLPEAGPFALLDVTGPEADTVRHVVTTLSQAAGRAVVDMDALASGLDLLAAVAGAELVVTDSPATLTLAVTGQRPAIGVAMELDGPWTVLGAAAQTMTVIGKAELAERLQSAERPGPDPHVARRLIRDAELLFDDVSDDLLLIDPPRLVETLAGRVDELLAERAAFQVVNGALRQRLARERAALVRHVHALTGPDASSAAAVDALRVQVDQLQAEINRIYATRAMRLLAPARRWYGRLRSVAP